jgi:hypothetical protein
MNLFDGKVFFKQFLFQSRGRYPNLQKGAGESKEDRVSAGQRRLSLWAALVCFCLTWIGVNAFLVQTRWFFSPQGIAAKLAASVSVFVCVMLALMLMSLFIVYAGPVLNKSLRLRLFLLAISGAAGGLCFWLGHMGFKGEWIGILNTTNLLLFANLVGTWMTAPLKRPGELLPLCVVMALADIFSLMAGPTYDIARTVEDYYKTGMKGAIPAGDFILIKIGVIGRLGLMPVFGVADWIIVVFFSTAAAKFGMNDNLAGKGMDKMILQENISLYFSAAASGLLAAVFLAQYLNTFVPALPLVAALFLGYIMVRYPEARRINKREWTLALGAVLIMGGLIGVRRFLVPDF